MVVSRDEFCFFKCRGPPLNFKIFISRNAFDDSTFFYQQLKFTWLPWVGIAFEFGGEINAPRWDPIPLYDTLKLTTRAFAVCQACNQCQRICHHYLLHHLLHYWCGDLPAMRLSTSRANLSSLARSQRALIATFFVRGPRIWE